MAERVPDITTGLGLLTPERWRRLWDGIAELERVLPLVASLQKAVREIPPRQLPAILTGYQALADPNIFRYSWVEAIFDGTTNRWRAKTTSDGNVKSSNAGTSDFDWPAYNILEQGNNGSGVESGGVNIDQHSGSLYPAGFYLQPIRGEGGGWSANPGASGSWESGDGPGVLLTWCRIFGGDDGGRSVPTFALMNAHDGACGSGAASGGAASSVVACTTSGAVVSITGNYTASTANEWVLANATAGDLTVTLPPATDATGLWLHVKKTDATANTVTIVPDGAETIDGNLSVIVADQHHAASVTSDGSNWWIF